MSPKSGITLSNRYRIAETDSFRKLLRKNTSLERVYRRIVEVVYPMLRREPHFGPNIKRLKGDYSDFYRYRVGDYRLFYTIEEESVIVVVADLRSRQNAYHK
jgi:mRNA interferase RelE/StbE